MRARVGVWAAAAVALVLLSACAGAQAARGVDIDPAVSLKVAAAKSPQAAKQVQAAIKAVQAEEASIELEASQEVQQAESAVAAEAKEHSERSENGEESSEVSLAELEDDLANLMARKLKGEESEGEQLNVEIGLLVKKISAIKDAKAEAAQLAADGGKYVNHKLDPLVNILSTLRGLKDGLKGLNVSDFNTLQLHIKALEERIEEFQSEQSAESSQAATTTMCVEYDRCGNPHYFVTADEKKDNCGDDPCQSNTVVVPTIVHRTCEAPTCTVEAKSLTSTCDACHQERSVCHRQCGVKSGQSLDSVCQNKCEVRVRACHETCNSDVVRADVVHPYTQQVNSNCSGAPAGCKQAPQVVPKGSLSDRNVILSL